VIDFRLVLGSFLDLLFGAVLIMLLMVRFDLGLIVLLVVRVGLGTTILFLSVEVVALRFDLIGIKIFSLLADGRLLKHFIISFVIIKE
jgi:hypothetical protein